MAEGWKKDTATHWEVTDPAGAYTGLTARTAWFAKCRVVTLIGRPHLHLFHQEKTIPANIDLKLKIIPTTCAYLLKTVAPDHEHRQGNFKVKVMEARMFIRTKLISSAVTLGQERVLQTNDYSIR